MVSTRLLTVIVVTSLVSGVALPAGAVLPVRADLEVARPVVAAHFARPGSPLAPRQQLGLGTKLFDRGLAIDRVDTLSRTLFTPSVVGRVSSSDLKVQAIRNFDDGMTYADYVQHYRGLEVVDSHVGLRFKNGRHVLSTAITFDDIAISTVPAIDGAHAEIVATRSLSNAGVIGTSLDRRSELVVYPQGDAAGNITYRLGYRNFVRTTAPVGNWMTIVAADGTDEILARHNKVAYAVGQFQVQIEPRHIGDAPLTVPAPGHNVGSGLVTDGDGIWETASGSANVPNAGPFFSIANQAATARTKSISVSASGFEQFTWMSTEAPLEELDPFYYANQTHEHQLRVAPDIAWYYQVLPINTNVSGTCNAYYDGASLNFFPTGGGCNSTSRIADVIGDSKRSRPDWT